jgi:hypothetical protein
MQAHFYIYGFVLEYLSAAYGQSDVDLRDIKAPCVAGFLDAFVEQREELWDVLVNGSWCETFSLSSLLYICPNGCADVCSCLIT